MVHTSHGADSSGDAGTLPGLLRAEAESCRQSAIGNGEYNTAFWVASIVLDSLAKRLDP
jgi:hypothetical protein